MKRIIISSLFCLIISISVRSQEKPILLNGKVLNAETLEPINDQSYHSAFVRDNGRIDVQHGPAWVWGVIDWQGNTIIEPRYNSMLSFNEGIAIGAIKGLGMSYEVIDEKGEILFDNKFKNIRPYKNGLAAFLGSEAKYGFVDKKGKQVIKPQYDSYGANILIGKDQFIATEKGKKWGIINGKNKVILPIEYEKITHLKDDVFLVEVPDSKTPTSQGSFGSTLKHSDYGLWSATTGMIMEPTIDHVHGDFNFLEYGYLKFRSNRYEKWNLMNLSGQKILKEGYDEILPISGRLIGVGKNNPNTKQTLYAVSDFNGSLKTQYELSSVGSLKNGFIPICIRQGTQVSCGFTDENIKLKIPLNYSSVQGFDEAGHAIVSRSSKVSNRTVSYKGVIDQDNNIILPLVFGRIERVSSRYYKANALNNGFEHLIDVSNGLPIDEDKSTYLLRLYADFYFEFSDFTNAAIFYEKVVNSVGYGNKDIALLGKSYSRSDQYDKALKNLDRLLSLPESKLTNELKVYRGEKAYVLWKQGKMQEAKAVYDQTFEGFTKRLTEEYSNMRLEYAEMLAAMNLGHDAIKEYKEVLRFYQSAWAVYDKLGVLQLTIDLKDDAITSFNKSIGFNPGGKDAYFFRGQAYALKNEHGSAIRDYEKAIQIEGSGELTTIHKYLADSWFANGTKDKACGLWKQLAPYDEKSKSLTAQNCN